MCEMYGASGEMIDIIIAEEAVNRLHFQFPVTVEYCKNFYPKSNQIKSNQPLLCSAY